MVWDMINPELKLEYGIRKILQESDDLHYIFTPFELCKEIIEKVHSNLIPTKDTKYLVIANLEFVVILLARLKLCNIGVDNVTFATSCSLKERMALALGVKVIRYNTLIEVFGEVSNVDCVIGNLGSPKTKTLWHKMLISGFCLLKKGGLMALITPSTWTTNKLYQRVFLKYNMLHINIDECAKYFPGETTTFSYFVMQNQQPQKHNIYIAAPNETTVVQELPPFGLKHINSHAWSILSKLLRDTEKFVVFDTRAYATSKLGNNDPTISKTQTKTCRYQILHKTKDGKDEFFYSSVLDEKQRNTPRVIVQKWCAQYKNMVVSDTLLTCERFHHFPVNTLAEAYMLRTILLSPLYRYVVNSLVSGPGPTKNSMNQFPKIDLSRSWTNAQLYQHFGLTPEEIRMVEK